MGFAVPLDMWFRGSFDRDNCPDYSSLWHCSDKNTQQRIVTGTNLSAIGQKFAQVRVLSHEAECELCHRVSRTETNTIEMGDHITVHTRFIYSWVLLCISRLFD